MRTVLYIIFVQSVYCFSLFTLDVFNFWNFSWFWKIKWLLWKYYFSNSPYEIVSKFCGRVRPAYDNLIYGETPFVTMKHILEYAGGSEGLRFCDLGSGRGTTVFFAQCYFGMNAVGFEIIPDYVDIANNIKEKLNINGVEFLNRDFLESDLSGFDFIYVTPTTWDNENMKNLVDALKSAKTGASIISVSIELPYDFLTKTGEKKYPFSWAKTEVYFYLKN